MHKIVVLYPEPEDRTAFIEYYEKTHLPLAAQLPGLRSWRYSTDISLDAQGNPAKYFAIFEAEFSDVEAFRVAMASPEGQAVAVDVPNYATGGAITLDYEITGGN